MMIIVEGVVAGILAGILMSAASHVCFMTRLFRSSLIFIDGEFLFRTLNVRPNDLVRFLVGSVIHLVTSGVFGGIYTAVMHLLALTPLSALLISTYFFVLWLSMLFIALPIAGQGLLGKKAGTATWFEQFILHIIFGAGYYAALATCIRFGHLIFEF
jgi:hypothetical protein